MASDADINLVKTHLSGVDSIWEDSKISDTIDALGSASKTVRAFWTEIANGTYLLTDVSESSSSRNTSIIYRNAMEQLARWDKIIADEETQAKAGVRFGRITRSFPA